MKTRMKRGISIAEMCIVLAVISVVSTVVVSFTLMFGARSSASAGKLNALNDLSVSQTVLEHWVDTMQSLNAQITADETGLSAKVGNDTYQVTLRDGQLVAPLPGGQKVSCLINIVREMQFHSMTQNGRTLYFCTIHYWVQNPVGQEVHFQDTFTIFSRIGQTV